MIELRAAAASSQLFFDGKEGGLPGAVRLDLLGLGSGSVKDLTLLHLSAGLALGRVRERNCAGRGRAVAPRPGGIINC